MISGENLTFCAADSNMYIGRIHPLIYCSSFFFPHSALNFRNSHPCINLHFYRISLIYAWRAERVVLKNVRMFFLSGILEEMVIQSCFYHAIEKRRKSWKKVGKEKGWDGRSRQWRWERAKEGQDDEEDDWGEETRWRGRGRALENFQIFWESVTIFCSITNCPVYPCE